MSKLGRLSDTLKEAIDTGTITTIDPTGTTLIDSGATDWLTTVQVGDIITNTTDVGNPTATVVSVDSNTQITHTALAGGTTDDWEAADGYSIVAPTTFIVDFMNEHKFYAPKGSHQTVNVMVSEADATVAVTGDANPASGSTWHGLTLTDQMVSIPWPVTGILVTSGAAATVMSVVVDLNR